MPSLRTATQAISLFAATLVVSALPQSADAALMAGHRVGFQWYYSDLDHPYDPAEVVEVTPTGSLYIVHSQSTLTLSDNRIRFESSIGFNTHFNGGPFNGFVLTDLDNAIPDFLSVNIDPETNLSGFTVSRIALSPNSIAVNFQNLDNKPGMLVSLTLEGQSVPEPSPVGLLGAAALGAYAISLRQGRRVRRRSESAA